MTLEDPASRMRALIDIPGCRSPAPHPTDDRIAFLGDASGMAQVWLWQDGAARQLSYHHEPVNSVLWSPDGTRLLFTADCGGDERWQIHLLDPTTGASRAVTADPTTVHIWGAWSPDGTSIAFTANAVQKDSLLPCILDLASGVATPVASPPGHHEVLAFSPDGVEILLRHRRHALSDQELLRVIIATGDTLPVLPPEGDGPAAYGGARFLRDRSGLAISDHDRDRPALWRFDRAGRAITCLLADPGADVEAFALSRDQESAVIALNRDGFSDLRHLDLATGERHTLPLPFAGVARNLSLPGDGQNLLCTLSAADRPPAIWRIGLAPGAMAAPLIAGTPEVPLKAGPPLALRFDSFDGESIPYFRYTPAGPRPAAGWPTVFAIHGGPELQWRPDFRPEVQWMLEHGIQVIAPNIRGSTGYGRRFHGLDDRSRRLDSLGDVVALRALLVADGVVDGARCGIYGRSYGGYMVLAALTETPDLWRFGANFYGIGNFFTHLLATGPWARQMRVAEYGDPDTDAALLRRISPAYRLDQIQAPLFMVHADRDPRVPPGESETVNSIMAGLGKRCEFLRIHHEGHGFLRNENARHVYGALANFILREL